MIDFCCLTSTEARRPIRDGAVPDIRSPGYLYVSAGEDFFAPVHYREKP